MQCNAIICWNWNRLVDLFLLLGTSQDKFIWGETQFSLMFPMLIYVMPSVYLRDESKEKHTTFLLRPAQEKYGKHYYLIDWQVKALKVLSTYDVT